VVINILSEPFVAKTHPFLIFVLSSLENTQRVITVRSFFPLKLVGIQKTFYDRAANLLGSRALES
jgi:hypothetical protein